MIAPPPTTAFNFLSLGAGVQSSAMALMAARGLITPMPDAAIFADTQAEPKAVYEYLNYLAPLLPFPVHIVTAGNLHLDSLVVRKNKYGKKYVRTLIPAFVETTNGKGILSRKCTRDYKVMPIAKAVKRLANIKRGETRLLVTQWIGISSDELQRMREIDFKWQQARWPLVELRMSRRDCLNWLNDNSYKLPPKSACYFCPFHSDPAWRTLKHDDPIAFQKAIGFERQLQEMGNELTRLRGTPYLHPSLAPLDTVDFLTEEDKGQGSFWNHFDNECSGMCGT